jgi:hypothetical protein
VIAPSFSSEWLKFRTIRSTTWTIVVILGLSVGIGALVCWAERQQWASQSLAEHVSFDPVGTSLAGFFFAEIAVGVLGVLVMSSEYASGSIRATLAATPERLVVLCAKALVTFLAILALGEVCAFSAFFVGQAILHGATPTATLSSPGALRAVVLGGLSLALLAVLGLGIATAVRHTAASITIYVGLTFVLFLVVLALPSSWNTHVFRYLPEILTTSMRSSRTTTVQYGALFSPAVSTLVLASYALGSLIIGGVLLVRRDA